MKKVILNLFFILFLSATFVLAEEIATSSPTLDVDKDEIKIFKEKIASKVAEIEKQKGDEAVAGFLVSSDNNKFFIQSETEKYQINTDDLLTKFYKIAGSKISSLGKNDLKKDEYIIAVGLKTDNVLEANAVYRDEKYLVRTGQITEINKENYQVKVVTFDKEELLLDIEIETKQLILNPKTLTIEKTGFSKIKAGDTVHFIVKKTQIKEKNKQFSAIKIIIVPQELFVK